MPYKRTRRSLKGGGLFSSLRGTPKQAPSANQQPPLGVVPSGPATTSQVQQPQSAYEFSRDMIQKLAPTTYEFDQDAATPIRKLTTYLRIMANEEVVMKREKAKADAAIAAKDKAIAAGANAATANAAAANAAAKAAKAAKAAVAPDFNEAFNPPTKSFTTPLDLQTMLRYEAFLGQCAFLSRLAYNPTDIFVQTMQQGMEFDQPNKNKLVTAIETAAYQQLGDYAAWFTTLPQGIAEAKANKAPNPIAAKVGRFFPKSGCTITQWYNKNSKINSKKTLFVVCKGSSSIADFVKDLKATPIPTASVNGLQGIPGQTHKGFVDHISAEIADIVAAIDTFSAGMDQIVFTGHSLGGAAATLIAFIYARARPWSAGAPTRHLITFGAPQIFTEDTRVCFNEHLLNGSLTFDRVVANGDNITNVPAIGYSHPGFRILKTEAAMDKIPFKAKTFDKSGRSGYIRQIRLLAVGPGKAPDNNDVIMTNIGGAEVFVAAQVPETVVPPAAEAAAAGEEKKEVAAAEDVAIQLAKEAAAADASGSTMAGGGYSTDIYKQIAQRVYPNTVTYNCNKAAAAKMAGMTLGLTTLVACHVSYAGIEFLAALRLPVLPRPPFFLRKKEPTEITDLVTYDGPPNPAVRTIVMRQGDELNLGKAVSENQTISNANKANMTKRMERAMSRITIQPTNTKEVVYGMLRAAAMTEKQKEASPATMAGGRRRKRQTKRKRNRV